MSAYCEEDVAALGRVIAALEKNPSDIHKAELALLKQWAMHAGAVFPPAPTAKPTAAAEAASEKDDDSASEPDDERWTLDDGVPAEIPEKSGEPSD